MMCVTIRLSSNCAYFGSRSQLRFVCARMVQGICWSRDSILTQRLNWIQCRADRVNIEGHRWRMTLKWKRKKNRFFFGLFLRLVTCSVFENLICDKRKSGDNNFFVFVFFFKYYLKYWAHRRLIQLIFVLNEKKWFFIIFPILFLFYFGINVVSIGVMRMQSFNYVQLVNHKISLPSSFPWILWQTEIKINEWIIMCFAFDSETP